jgi:ribosomal protein L11 methyltransferase
LPWTKLKLKVDSHEAETAATALEESGATAVAFEDAGDQPLFDERPDAPPANPALWAQTWVSGLFDTQAEALAAISVVAQALHRQEAPVHETETLPDQDWERVWLERWQPLHFGGALWVCPSWRTPPDPAAVNVILDPGLAFGTGTHATTALCLEWLAQHPVGAHTILDYGCGSGILAIAALKLGAREAFGVDVDTGALAVSEENAQRNGVADRYHAMLPAALPVELQVDIVIANILAEPLIALAPQIGRRVKPGGTLLLSGMLATQVDEVRAAYADDFHLQLHLRDEWALLAGARTT